MLGKPLFHEQSIQPVSSLKNFTDYEAAVNTDVQAGRLESSEACFIQVVLNILNVAAINSRPNFLLNIMTDRNYAPGFFSKGI